MVLLEPIGLLAAMLIMSMIASIVSFVISVSVYNRIVAIEKMLSQPDPGPSSPEYDDHWRKNVL